jgi:hypothetical protein
MAISQVSKGVYLVSPDAMKSYKDTYAYQISQIFTKQRAENYEMAKAQADREMKSTIGQYELEMKQYQSKVESLAKRRDELEQMKLDVAAGRLKATDAANIAALREATDRQRLQLDYEKAKADTMALSGGSTSQSSGKSSGTTAGRGGGGGGGAGGGLRLTPAEEAEVGTASATGSSTAEKATALKSARQAGKLPSTEQADTDNQNKALVDSMTAQRTSSAVDADQARADVIDELNASGHGDITDSYFILTSTPEEAGGAGGGSSSSSRQSSSRREGATQVTKRPTLGAMPGVPAVAAPATASADEVNAAIQLQIEALKDPTAPTLSLPDYITRVRDINAGRFGPTNAFPSYRQRNVMQGIYNMKPEEQQALIAQYRAQGASQPAAVATPTVAAPAMEAPSPVRVAQLPAGVSAGIANMPSTPATQPTPVPRPTYTPPPASAEEIVYTPPTRGANYEPDIGTRPESEAPDNVPYALTPDDEAMLRAADATESAVAANARRQQVANRRAELEAVLGRRAQDTELIDSMMSQGFSSSSVPTADLVAPGVRPSVPRPVYVPTQTSAPIPSMAARIAGAPPASMGARPEGVLPPSIPVAGPSAADAAPRSPVFGTPESRAMMQTMNETPGMITGGTNLAINKAQRAAAESKAAADVKAARGAGILKGPATPETQWMDQRMTAALTLAKQPDRLSRVVASKVGKEATAYYTADKAKGFSVQHTVTTLKSAYQADPEARNRAVEIVLATAIANHDATNP